MRSQIFDPVFEYFSQRQSAIVPLLHRKVSLMPDVFFASILVVWNLTGQAAVIERSEPVPDKITCEKMAADLVAKHTDFYNQLPVKLLPRCEKWEPSIFNN